MAFLVLLNLETRAGLIVVCLSKYSAQTLLQVRYSERFVEELHLPVEKLDFGQAKPQLLVADPTTSPAWPPVARPVLQQDSNNGLAPVNTSTSKALQVKQCHVTV